MDMFNQFASQIQGITGISEAERTILMRNLANLKGEKVNVLITGATGCGKSSTINALFGSEKAKVGQGSSPETMHIARYDFQNIVLFDSPGLGDGKEADIRHAKGIMDKLLETKSDGSLLIDLVLVILDGSSRDLGTSYQLITEVIIPNLGEDTSRLLIAINQADVAMKGRYWNYADNQPEPLLLKFLDEKVLSTQKRIKEATGINVDPIYYAAGYKDGDEEQYPWNLSKLMAHILRHTKPEKRVVFANDINKNAEMWKSDDRLENYREEIKKNFIDSLVENVSKGLQGAAEVIGNVAGAAVDIVSSAARTVVSGVSKAVSAIGSAVGGFFSSWF